MPVGATAGVWQEPLRWCRRVGRRPGGRRVCCRVGAFIDPVAGAGGSRHLVIGRRHAGTRVYTRVQACRGAAWQALRVSRRRPVRAPGGASSRRHSDAQQANQPGYALEQARQQARLAVSHWQDPAGRRRLVKYTPSGVPW
jgi:hypothetical protein